MKPKANFRPAKKNQKQHVQDSPGTPGKLTHFRRYARRDHDRN